MSTDARMLDFVAGQHWGVLAVVKPDGRPHLSNVGYAYDADARLFRISVTDGRAKTRHLRADPRVTLHVASKDFWTWVAVEGTAELTPVAADAHDTTVEESAIRTVLSTAAAPPRRISTPVKAPKSQALDESGTLGAPADDSPAQCSRRPGSHAASPAPSRADSRNGNGNNRTRAPRASPPRADAHSSAGSADSSKQSPRERSGSDSTIPVDGDADGDADADGELEKDLDGDVAMRETPEVGGGADADAELDLLVAVDAAGANSNHSSIVGKARTQSEEL